MTDTIEREAAVLPCAYFCNKCWWIDDDVSKHTTCSRQPQVVYFAPVQPLGEQVQPALASDGVRAAAEAIELNLPYLEDRSAQESVVDEIIEILSLHLLVSPTAEQMKAPPVTAVPAKCVKCGHNAASKHDGRCIELVGMGMNADTCGCNCEFPAPAAEQGEKE